MQNASASAPASSLPLRPRRAPVSASAARSTFADALTYAFDIAFRAPESLSLAQRAAYGLERPRTCQEPRYVARRAQLGEWNAPKGNAPNVARRAQLGECNAPKCNAPNVVRRAQLRECNAPKCNAPNVVRRAQLGEYRSTTHLSHPYFTFNARAAGAEITFVVANGRAFAGVRSWTR